MTTTISEDLRRGLLVIVRTQPLAERIATEHGTKYIILGYINTPSYSLFHLRTVWFVRHRRDRATLCNGRSTKELVHDYPSRTPR